MADKPQVKQRDAAGARSSRADPDREDTGAAPKAPKTSGGPVRDVREEPAANPNGGPKGKVTPRPPENPAADA